jgi:hypothetical protein
MTCGKFIFPCSRLSSPSETCSVAMSWWQEMHSTWAGLTYDAVREWVICISLLFVSSCVPVYWYDTFSDFSLDGFFVFHHAIQWQQFVPHFCLLWCYAA